MTERFDLTPAALYARVSSDRQDVDLSIAAQLRALRDCAPRHAAWDTRLNRRNSEEISGPTDLL